MNRTRSWFGWIAIGLGALALLVALGGRGFGPQVIAAAWNGSGAPQSYAQSAGPQANGPQANGPQSAPGANAQQATGPQANGQQNAAGAPGANSQRRPGRPEDRGFGMGGWLHFLSLKTIGVLALLAIAGVWLIRGRAAGNVGGSQRVAPAQGLPLEPAAPADESEYDKPADESEHDEPRDQA